MPAGAIAAFWSVSILLIAVPGADWAFTIGAGLRGRSVLPAVGGLVLGYAGMTVVVAAGVGVVVAENPNALTALSVLGGGYLMWHGARTLAAPPAHSAPPVSAQATAETADATNAGTDAGPAAGSPVATGRATLLQGVGVSGLNPKGLLIFIALLPQFADPDRPWPMAVQMAALGLVFTLTCAVFYLALGTVARTILHSRPAAARTVSRLSGAAMIALGAYLIFERLA
ncbi:threonine/homoserine/homoserine lactone efflux protein [Murinocardiopsis flavida]|uniref:Threonine/homoserine/homoserine lactone efflux protein n=1 Tax=Murinocardiopsis flavida TaxID=645275 RepID=A0A2P8DS85_9ACTN|nr:LysE family translocator [Murinocardiopsis flavida]PSL00071.1 threonine/homoserine/homoserine lactone efflux protein [Murinocardiopsis flavida]